MLFARHQHVPFTNSQAEENLRMATVKKVSGCFRSEQYAHAYCRISSYLQSMPNKGYNPLTAIQMTLAGKTEGELLPIFYYSLNSSWTGLLFSNYPSIVVIYTSLPDDAALIRLSI